MIKRSGAVSIAYNFGIGLLALTIPSLDSSAHAQSADLVLCDRLAADPADPDKPTDVKGTSDIAQSDIATAIKFCRIASAASRRALYQLGRAYAADRQLPEAVGAYRKAADKGSTSAMVELGVLLATGSGVAKDPAAARKLFERAAAAGDPRGALNLAALSYEGGAPSDPVEARALLSRAAETNSAEAQYQLGLMIADGIGGSKDDVAARALFEKAAALKRRPRKVIPGHWSGWAHSRKTGEADRGIRMPPRRITREPRRSAMKLPRPLSSARNVATRSETNAETSWPIFASRADSGLIDARLAHLEALESAPRPLGRLNLIRSFGYDLGNCTFSRSHDMYWRLDPRRRRLRCRVQKSPAAPC